MARGPLRVALALPLLAAGFGAASAAAAGPAAPLCAQAAGANHVGIVIEHDTVVKHQCVSFSTATILALTVLQDSGIEYATQLYNGIGEAVCQIDNVPSQYSDCLPFSGSYWVFFVAGADGRWMSAAHGISATTLSDGDFVGFRYDPLGGADPPPVAPTGVCPVSTPTPTPVPTAPPTSSAAPMPTGTTSPSGTPRPAGPTPTGTTATPGSAGSTTASSTGPGPTGVVAGVLGASSPGASPDATLGATPTGALGSSFSPALVVAIVAVAALIGLLGIQGLRRRRQ
jgi:hypothetical protein